MVTPNPWKDWWEGMGGSDFFNQEGLQRAGFMSFSPKWTTPNMKRFYQNQFSNVYDEYLGALGRMVSGGGQDVPTAWYDYLDKFNFGQNFAQQSPSQRGAETRRFAPPTRFQF